MRASAPAVAILALGLSYPAVAQRATCEKPIPIELTGKSCAPLLPPAVSCDLWPDVEGHLRQPNHNTVQRAADLFSWQTFLALNWPAGERRGEPDRKASFTAAGPRVWETWKEAFEVYLPDGRQPPPWNAPEPIPAGCRGAERFLVRGAKVDDVLDAVVQALPTDATLPASLKDQQGRLVRYGIRLNEVLFDYVANPSSSRYAGTPLYNGLAQAKAKKIEFPVGSQLVKSAWRAVSESEAPFFHTTRACVCETEGVDSPAGCRIERMGLGGLHVMTKTESAPSWIWSTFEHVANLAPTHGVQPLNDPACPPALCPPNRQTAANIPNQVRRVIPIPATDPDCSRPEQAVDNVVQLNGDVAKALGDLGSVFRNYELVGTQWPAPADERTPKTVFDAVPALLANSTMETFSQNTSSCMGCHAMSRTLDPSRFVSGDFSFTLNNAQPRPPGAFCEDVEASFSCSDSIIPPPLEPETEWDYANWREIVDGYTVATRTYELTNPRYIRSRLHCESCHLNGGGNRDAAWWVNMWQAYEYPATTKLQDRINGCFERSMNGRAICSTAEGPADCQSNPVMRSLITYMGWLTEQYFERYPNGKPCRGYPPFDVGGGNYDRGRALYVQKCSFCHNAEGQGRYESHTYFRPALWGPDSFNACAGMGRVEDLGAFVRWNMPYTSGGLLTTKEANDVATYIDAQCRPGKGGIGPDGEPCPLSPSCIDSQQPEPRTSVPADIVTPDPPVTYSCPEFKAMAEGR